MAGRALHLRALARPWSGAALKCGSMGPVFEPVGVRVSPAPAMAVAAHPVTRHRRAAMVPFAHQNAFTDDVAAPAGMDMAIISARCPSPVMAIVPALAPAARMVPSPVVPPPVVPPLAMGAIDARARVGVDPGGIARAGPRHAQTCAVLRDRRSGEGGCDKRCERHAKQFEPGTQSSAHGDLPIP